MEKSKYIRLLRDDGSHLLLEVDAIIDTAWDGETSVVVTGMKKLNGEGLFFQSDLSLREWKRLEKAVLE